MIDNALLTQYLSDMGRRSLYDYCRIRHPQVYTKSRPHAKVLTDTLQDFLEDKLVDVAGNKISRLILNLPPRHAKSFSAINAVQWYLGQNPNKSVFAISYNSILSGRFAKSVRDGIQERKAGPKLVFSDFFPEVKIRQGDAAYDMWSLEGSHFSFLATSPSATITGIGTSLLIIDDLIKDANEAYNERILDEQWQWYTDTVLSRLEQNAKQLVIMTRWSTNDLCGRLLSLEPEKWHVIKMPAYDETTDTMLAPDILSKEDYLDRKGKTDPQIFEANYQQSPTDGEDKLYKGFKTYDILPTGTNEAYFDTADEGDDFLAGGTYVVKDNTAYITDILYTQDPMEKTESQAAIMLRNNATQIAHIESNNGGKGFARNVEAIMREKLGYTSCGIEWFHQGENKLARILSQATNATNSIVFPTDWQTRWPVFARDILNISRMSKWVHDDAQDFITGIVEKSLSRELIHVYQYDGSTIPVEVTPKETLYVGQLIDEGFFRPVVCRVKGGIIETLAELEPDQMIDAPSIVRKMYTQNPIVWYLDISQKDVFPSYRQAILDAGIQLQVGTIVPSEIERPVIINKLLASGKLKIGEPCTRLKSALSSRLLDKSGSPEKGDGASSGHWYCNSLEYVCYRISSSQNL